MKSTVQDVKIPEKERSANKPNESYTLDRIQEVDMSDEEIFSLAMKIWGMRRAETQPMESCSKDNESDITELSEFLSGVEWDL